MVFHSTAKRLRPKNQGGSLPAPQDSEATPSQKVCCFIPQNGGLVSVYAHRDVLGLNDGLRGKLLMSRLNNNEAFEYAIRDLTENAEIYLEDFLAH